MPAVRVRTNEDDFVQAGRGCLPSREPDDTGAEVGVTDIDGMSAELHYAMAEALVQTIGSMNAHTAQAIIIKALFAIDGDVAVCDCLDGQAGVEEWRRSLECLAEAQAHARAFFSAFVTEHIMEEGRQILKGNAPDGGQKLA